MKGEKEGSHKELTESFIHHTLYSVMLNIKTPQMRSSAQCLIMDHPA